MRYLVRRWSWLVAARLATPARCTRALVIAIRKGWRAEASS